MSSLERALYLTQETRNLQAESRVRLALADAHEQAAEPMQTLAQLRAYLTLKGGECIDRAACPGADRALRGRGEPT